MLYEHYLEIARGVNELIDSLRSQSDARVRDEVEALLERLDLLHREALVRLADALRRSDARDAFERAAGDPFVRVLLGLYDIVDLGLARRESADGFVPLEQLRRRRSAAAEDPGAAPGTRT